MKYLNNINVDTYHLHLSNAYYTTSRVNQNVKHGLLVTICVNAGTSTVANVPLLWRTLIIGKAMYEG